MEVTANGRVSSAHLISGLHKSFGAKGLKIERPEEISSTLKKALAMQGPVIVGVPVDYRDNHRLMEDVHPEALN